MLKWPEYWLQSQQILNRTQHTPESINCEHTFMYCRSTYKSDIETIILF